MVSRRTDRNVRHDQNGKTSESASGQVRTLRARRTPTNLHQSYAEDIKSGLEKRVEISLMQESALGKEDCVCLVPSPTVVALIPRVSVSSKNTWCETNRLTRMLTPDVVCSPDFLARKDYVVVYAKHCFGGQVMWQESVRQIGCAPLLENGYAVGRLGQRLQIVWHVSPMIIPRHLDLIRSAP